MTAKEFEKLAIGIETGYTDRNGTPIRVGDEIIYYRRVAMPLSEDEDINTIPRKWIYGKGFKRFVYTGKVIRYRHTVGFSLEYGLDMLPDDYWRALSEKDINGNCCCLLVDNERLNPKLTFEDIEEYRDESNT